jgi:hypothetical protein
VALACIRSLRVVPDESPAWFKSAGMIPWVADVLSDGLSGLGLVLEIVLWFVIGLAALLSPLVVAEEMRVVGALREWAILLRENLRRIMLAEAMALGLGVVITLPFVLPVWLAEGHYHPPMGLVNVAYGAAFAPLLAFLAVANVFIYLDVRYEHAG